MIGIDLAYNQHSAFGNWFPGSKPLVAQAMNTQLSLSTLLLLALAAVALVQAYKCFANRNAASYKRISGLSAL